MKNKKRRSFDKKYWFLIVTIISVISIVIFSIIMYIEKKVVLWNIIGGMFFVTLMSLLAYYAEDIVEWSLKKDGFLKRIFIIISKSLSLSLIASLYGTYCFSKLFFVNNQTNYEWFCFVPLIVLNILFIAYYSKELYGIAQAEYRIQAKIELFVFVIIHIVQLFANVYLLFLSFNPLVFCNLTAKTPLQLLFDILYFSCMTFVGGDGGLVPQSRWIQGVVMIESLILPIYISIIIFGFCEKKK